MEKSIIIEDPPKNTLSTGRVTLILAGSVAALAVAFIITIACGTWYVGHLQASCDTTQAEVPKHNTEKREYDLDVKNKDEVDKEHVVVDEEKKTEFTIVRVPQTSHISYIMTSDYKRRLIAIYNSESNNCLLVPMEMKDLSFQETVDFIKRHDGEAVEPKRTLNVTAGEPVESNDDIPEEMENFCTLHNSYWAKDQTDVAESRQKRAWCWRVCGRVCNCCYCIYACYTRCYG